jgi:hypothetical protein
MNDNIEYDFYDKPKFLSPNPKSDIEIDSENTKMIEPDKITLAEIVNKFKRKSHRSIFDSNKRRSRKQIKSSKRRSKKKKKLNF